MLTRRRRALWWALALAAATVFLFVAVGRHPAADAPRTTLPFLGHLDDAIARAMDRIHNTPTSFVARILNFIGQGAVTIPLRIAVALWLVWRRWWRQLGAWLMTWAVAELVLSFAKGYFHRGRPPGSLVLTKGFSFPSGHAVAGASIAVALVLVLLPPGRERRRWELAAAGFAFVMACSRVYLLAHWFTDAVAGVLLGTGVALACAALVTEVRDVARRHGATPAEAVT